MNKLTIILTIALLLAGATTWAQREQIGTSTAFWELSISGSDTTLIISGTGDIPDFANVNDAPWYSINKTIHHLQIGDSITRIGNWAIYDFAKLRTASIGNSVASIGNSAFLFCSALPSITLPASLTSIGSYAFEECSGLTSITLPASVTSIGDNAFAYCIGLTEVVNQRPTPVTINANVFSGVTISACSLKVPLASVSLYQGAAVWQDFNIAGAYTVDAVVNNPAGGSVTGGGIYPSTAVLTATPEDGYTFRCWSSNGVEISTANPLSLTLANDTTVMAHFAQPIGISSTWWELIINESDTTLKITGTGAMPDFNIGGVSWHPIATTLRYLEIGDNITHIGDFAFFECIGLTSVSIPNSVTSIGNNAFYVCIGLTSITIPASITAIGVSIFAGCISLTSIIADAANPNYSSLDGVLYNKDKTSLVQYPEGKPDASFTIPNSVTNIGDWAFSYCRNLTSVTIPNSVTDIGRSAFMDCYGLTSLTIGNSVTNIGESAFYLCYGLTSVSIPNSVTSIGDGAFMDCSGLTSVTIPNSVTSIGGDAFNGCSSLSSVTIPNSVTDIRERTFYKCTSLTSVTIPNSVTSIGGDAFNGCSGLTSVTIPNSVTNIGNYAFWGCISLTSVTIPNSVTTIGGYAFYGCSGLTSVTIPNSVTNIGSYAFGGCTSLTEIINNNPEPVAIAANVFTGVDKPACTLKVPISSVSKYEAAAVWQDFNIVGEGYIVSASVNNAAYGSVSGEGLYPANTAHSVTAIANEGYVFTNWTVSGIVISTESSYSFTVTQDIELKANFTPALSNLTVSEGTLTPEFHQNTLNYSVIVDNSITSITLTAQCIDPDAAVLGGGTHALNTGDNTFTILVIDQDKVSTLTYTVKVTRSTVGIDEWRMENGELRVYPNPTKGQLTIDNGQLIVENVEVCDISGRMLQTFKVSKTLKVLDISHLSSGIYIIKIKTENGEVVKKIVKQ